MRPAKAKNIYPKCQWCSPETKVIYVKSKHKVQHYFLYSFFSFSFFLYRHHHWLLLFHLLARNKNLSNDTLWSHFHMQKKSRRQYFNNINNGSASSRSSAQISVGNGCIETWAGLCADFPNELPPTEPWLDTLHTSAAAGTFKSQSLIRGWWRNRWNRLLDIMFPINFFFARARCSFSRYISVRLPTLRCHASIARCLRTILYNVASRFCHKI